MRLERHWRPYPVDPSCVLYLPFYKYGGNIQKIWDQSGQGNHGIITGAAPATYPKLSGVELVTNGGMENGAPPTGWTALNTPETFEQSGVRKHSGSYSAHIIDSTPGYRGFAQGYTSITGKIYKISFWYYLVSGSLRSTIIKGDNSGFNYNSDLTTNGAWTYFELIYTETAGGALAKWQFKNSSTAVAAEFYIDDVSVQEVTGYEGIGWGFDGVDDSVDLGTNLSNYGTGSLTIMGWIRYMYSNFNSRFLSWRDTNALELYFSGNNDGLFTTYIVDSLTNSIAPNIGTLNPFKWTQFALVLDRTLNVANPYLGGAMGTPLDISGFTGTLNPAGHGYMGSFTGTSNFGKFNIGDVLIFNRALSATEIRSYYELTRHIYGV